MEAVLAQLRRDPPFAVYLWALWTRVPAVMWLIVIAFEVYVLWLSRGV